MANMIHHSTCESKVTNDLYCGRYNEQRASLLTRITHRAVTFRKVVLYIFALAIPAFAQPTMITFGVGSVFVALGLALRMWCFGHLEKNQELVTTGPFAFTRNPAYLGSALIALGFTISAGNPTTTGGIALWIGCAIGLALFFILYLPRKYRKEYARLAKLFPGEFERHARHVPNFIPRLTPWHSGSQRRFSWSLLRLNHEVVWPLVCVIALGVMWFD